MLVGGVSGANIWCHIPWLAIHTWQTQLECFSKLIFLKVVQLYVVFVDPRIMSLQWAYKGTPPVGTHFWKKNPCT